MTSTATYFTLLMVMLTFLVPRRWIALPLIFSGCYMTMGQRIIILELDFTIFRIILIAAWLRLLLRSEAAFFRWNTMDRVLVAWSIVTVITGGFLEGFQAGFVHRLGVIYNTLGLYFFFRLLIRDRRDIEALLLLMALASLPLALLMLHEKMTGFNLFYVFGGVPETTIIRDGRLRCQGSFGHPILAGSFGATLFPLCAGLWYARPGWRPVASVALLATTVITFTSASSGPLMVYAAIIMAFGLWCARNYMRTIRWLVVAMLVGLELVMKSHVWFLFGRLSNVIGGTGWHRAELIDSAIRHFGAWWLTGSTMTEDWIEFGVSNIERSADITNQFIFEGVSGGMFRMGLFIALVALAFQSVGRARRTAHRAGARDLEFLFWSIGCGLFAHILTFFSVFYFDQMVIFWNLALAMASYLRDVEVADATSPDEIADVIHDTPAEMINQPA